MKRGELGLVVVLSSSGPGLPTPSVNKSGGGLENEMVGASGSVAEEERRNSPIGIQTQIRISVQLQVRTLIV